ncbi:UNVERIFIED_CONTAM: hypothetical protein HDU68_003609 [Siphonaria sp. JEL0065]|nr:hypothetical protein HDU68_003609 [Siphonaria sp. JEL0065]
MYLNVTKQRSLLPPISPTTSTPISSHPRPAEYSGAAVFCGVTRLHVPPTDAPDTLEASKKPIEDLRRFDVQEFVPDGRSVTILGTAKGGWFGCTNLGNGLLGWRLVVPQEEKGAIAAGFAAMKNRELMNEAIKTNPKTGSNIMSMMGGPNSVVDQGVQKNLTRLNTDETSAEDKWNVIPSSPARKPGKLRLADTTPSVDDLEDDVGEGTSNDVDDEEGASARKSRRGRRSIDMSALQSALKPTSNVPQRLFSASELDNRSSTSPSRATFVPSSLFAAPNPLTGAEIRGLALKYAEPENFPHPIYAIIARTDPYLTTLQDTADLADNPLDTFTLPNPLGAGFPNPPNLHRGRVVLIGDAAHPVTTNANGSLAPGLAITDSVTLAKLIAKYTDPRWVNRGEDEILTPDGTFSDGFEKFMAASAVTAVPALGAGEDDGDDDVEDPSIRHERTVFEKIAEEFDRDRCGLATEVMKEARSESGRFNGPLGAKALINNSVVKSLWRMGKGVVKNATAGKDKETVNEETETYVSLMKRGAVKKGLPSLSV